MSDKEKRKRQKLVDELNDLCKNLSNKYDINNGGCLYVAYQISKHLSRLNIDWELILFSESEVIDLSQIHGRNLDIENYDLNVSHWAIEIPDIGTINVSNYWFSMFRCLTVTDLVPSDLLYVYRTLNWNDVYRVSNNRKVSNELTNLFKNYEN